jgi:hypothetical protein
LPYELKHTLECFVKTYCKIHSWNSYLLIVYFHKRDEFYTQPTLMGDSGVDSCKGKSKCILEFSKSEVKELIEYRMVVFSVLF